MRITNQVQRIHYFLRHIRCITRYCTLYKFWNLIRNLAELHLRVAVPRSLPPFIKIEPTPQCQLSCTTCWHSDVAFKRMFTPSMNLTLDEFKKIVDPIASTTLGISLSFRGEPLLSRELIGMIRYAHQKRIATTFPSNLSVRMNKAFAEELVSSGLDELYVSLDGASAETYEQYRVGGDFQRVLDNVQLLADAKRRSGNRHTRIIWKMVIFPHNKHEIPVQESSYRSLGFDAFERVIDNMSAEYLELIATSNRKIVEKKRPCFWLWNTAVINARGDVYPCCTHEQFGLGNAITTDFRDIWTGQKYRELRAAFSRDAFGENMHHYCAKCIGLSNATQYEIIRDILPAGSSSQEILQP
jgi:radical SAM protein with 4Fe4S-binding SPASM domain